MEEVIQRIVRREVAAAIESLRAVMIVDGEEVELTLRVDGEGGPIVAAQQDAEVQHGTSRESEALAGSRPPQQARAAASAPREVPRPITDEFLEHEVAPLYREAALAGEHPNKRIQETFDRSRSAVSQWLRECRQKGFLPETDPGRVSTFDDRGVAGDAASIEE